MLATTELFIESGNVYIETKGNVDSYTVFYASLRGRMARKSGLVLNWLGLRLSLGLRFGFRLELRFGLRLFLVPFFRKY